mgnify:FL=1
MTARTRLRLNAYALVSDAVERGIELGWNRAYKHTDDPQKDVFVEAMTRSVMELIDEVVGWERSG